jgi:hypothetical protein
MSDMRQRFAVVVGLALTICALAAEPSSGARGPQPAYFIYSNGTSGSVENAANWTVKITANGLVVPSPQGLGVDNNLFERSSTRQETLHIEFDDEGASSVGLGVPDLTYVAQLGVSGLSAGESLTYVASYLDGTNSGTVTVTSADLVNGRFIVAAPVSGFLDRIDIAAGPTNTTVRMQL